MNFTVRDFFDIRNFHSCIIEDVILEGEIVMKITLKDGTVKEYAESK